MSDVKPKRAPREAIHGPIASVAAVPPETGPATLAEFVPPAPPRDIAILPETPAATPVIVTPPEIAAAAMAVPHEPAPDLADSVEQPEAVSEDAWTALAEAQSALARGLEELAVEITGMTRFGMNSAAEAAVAMLGARTLAEAVEINAGLARRGVEAMIEGSAKLSEIGVKSLTEASRPVLSRFGANWRGVDAI